MTGWWIASAPLMPRNDGFRVVITSLYFCRHREGRQACGDPEHSSSRRPTGLWRSSGLKYFVIQIPPFRVSGFNQLNFICPGAPLELLFSGNGAFHGFVLFVPDEVVN